MKKRLKIIEKSEEENGSNEDSKKWLKSGPKKIIEKVFNKWVKMAEKQAEKRLKK